jgi:hypothetical protein
MKAKEGQEGTPFYLMSLASGLPRMALNKKRNGASRPVKNLAISKTFHHSPECLRTSAYTNSTPLGLALAEAD